LNPDHVEQAIKRATGKSALRGKSAPQKSRGPSKDSGGQNVHAGWSASGWIAGVESINSMISEALLQPVSSGATLPGETAQLDFIRSLGREDAAVGKAAVLQLLMRSPLIVRMADAIWDEAHTLAGQAAATAVELQSKFADDGAFTLRYGGMETFFEHASAHHGALSPQVRWDGDLLRWARETPWIAIGQPAGGHES
jgi:hypothetical protein